MFTFKNIFDAVYHNQPVDIDISPTGFCAHSLNHGQIEFISVNSASIKAHEESVKEEFGSCAIRMSQFLNKHLHAQIELTKKQVDKSGDWYMIRANGSLYTGSKDMPCNTEILSIQTIWKSIKHYFKSRPTIVITRFGNIMVGVEFDTPDFTEGVLHKIPVIKEKASRKLVLFMIRDENKYADDTLRDELIDFAMRVKATLL